MTSNHNRNPGVPLDLDWVMGAHVNKSAVERRVATLPLHLTVPGNLETLSKMEDWLAG